MVEGQHLPELVRGPVTRTMLALFAGASHDHVPLHIDSDFARAAGMDDVFAHGMLSMAWLAQALRSWVAADRIRSWKVRFIAITPLYATVTCRGDIIEIFEADGERRARLRIGASTDQHLETLSGEAIVAIA